jgi:N-acetyl-anhydromuramyl-L-alanine amidase AmpD
MGGSVKSGKPVSSDFLINRRGDIYQITKPYWYAYHTGPAYWKGRQEPDKTLNQQAVGIELECHEPAGQMITNLQYIACAALLARVLGYHGLDAEDVTTHAIIALPPGRKYDPLVFDWQNIEREWDSPSVEAHQLVMPAVLP